MSTIIENIAYKTNTTIRVLKTPSPNLSDYFDSSPHETAAPLFRLSVQISDLPLPF